MTLVARTSLFFLAALAVVLVGLCSAIYGLMRYQLIGQVEQRASSVAGNLAAAVEVGPAGLEWESGPHRFRMQEEVGGAPVEWAVLDEHGKLIDGQMPQPILSVVQSSRPATSNLVKEDRQVDGEFWRIAMIRMRPDTSDQSATAEPAGPAGQDEAKIYPELTLVAASPLTSAYSTLRTMALVLAVVSFMIWSLAAVAGRWLCAKALAPVARMADAVGSISADDLTQRLPPVETGDELQQLAAAFNDLIARLHQSFEQQKRFTAEASHQLRTPLTAMLGQIDVALRRERTQEEYRATLELAQLQAAKLRRIVEMLLFLSRQTAEAGPPELRPVELRTWLAEYMDQWKKHPRSADIHFQSDDGAAEGLSINAHEELLAEAINNLIDNACNYSEPGSPIALRLECGAAGPRLIVQDRGIGISATDVPHVFDAFFRSEQSRRAGKNGTGLGLAVARRILAVFGAEITVESTPGTGSRFIVNFPAAVTKSRQLAESTT